MDANVPFEYVTPTDLLKGLSGRYKVIYLPAQLSIRADLLPALHDYVRAGGRLVMDLPGAWYDQNTVLMPTGKGSPFASLFGASIDDFQYAGTNRIVRLGTDTLKGFVMNATPLGASVRARYDNGKPAVFEHAFGKGTAVLLGFQASLNSFGTANAFGKTAEVRRSEHMLLKYALSTIPRSFTCNGALAYRLAGEKADHYILINEGPTNTVRLETPGYSYRLVIDAVTGEKVNPASINLKGYDGRWLRFEK
jgi:beta-galactosidase